MQFCCLHNLYCYCYVNILVIHMPGFLSYAIFLNKNLIIKTRKDSDIHYHQYWWHFYRLQMYTGRILVLLYLFHDHCTILLSQNITAPIYKIRLNNVFTSKICKLCIQNQIFHFDKIKDLFGSGHDFYLCNKSCWYKFNEQNQRIHTK
ncbi:hypothetical protein PUN28_010915 [Cardiocondyla obscurior]|uniref:Uncharacterized protein n=1 Tax=Cardiocondyla obscurior TaxID=286306 RepID=A0AAW2FMU7_9HYME